MDSLTFRVVLVEGLPVDHTVWPAALHTSSLLTHSDTVLQDLHPIIMNHPIKYMHNSNHHKHIISSTETYIGLTGLTLMDTATCELLYSTT